MPLTSQAMENLKLGAGGSYSLSRDAIAHRIYDVRPFTAGAVDHTYFQQPIGAPFMGGIKTINETNLLDTGKLPNGQTFLAQRFGVALVAIVDDSMAQAITPDVIECFHNILSSSVFEIRLAGREFDFQIHGRNMVPMPISGYGALANAVRVGDMIASGWAKLDPTPIFIDQLVSFAVVQRIQNAVAAIQTVLTNSATVLSTYYVTMMVCLDGFLTRAK